MDAIGRLWRLNCDNRKEEVPQNGTAHIDERAGVEAISADSPPTRSRDTSLASAFTTSIGKRRAACAYCISPKCIASRLRAVMELA